MEFPAEETLILNSDELVLLLSAAGVTCWYGMESGTDMSFIDDELSLNRCISDLYRKGLIDWGESKAKVSERIRPVLDVLKSAQVCIECTGKEPPGLTFGSYCHDGRVVVAERSTMNSNEIKLTLMSSEEWISMFEKSGFFPKVIEDAESIDVEHMFPEPEDITADFCVRSIPEGKLLEQLMLFDCGVYGMIIQNSRTASTREVFTKDRVKGIMQCWTGGNSQ